MKKSDRERRTDASTCKMMPQDFEPGPYEVLIGRGRRCTMHWGNQRFRSMIHDELEGYAAADCKRHKSSIIGRVLGDIKKHSPHAGFVKKDVSSGRWLSLTDAASRVTIAQAFRDALEDSYRSSKHSKQIKRRIEKKSHHSEESTLPPLPTPAEDQVNSNEDIFFQQEEVDLVSGDALMAKLGEMDMDLGFEDLDLDPLPLDPVPAAAPAPSTFEEDVISDEEFNLLYQAFASNNSDASGNPFEPLPIAIPSSSRKRSRHSNSKNRSNKHGYVVKEGYTPSSTAFGSNTPFRDVRVAMSA